MYGQKIKQYLDGAEKWLFPIFPIKNISYCDDDFQKARKVLFTFHSEFGKDGC